MKRLAARDFEDILQVRFIFISLVIFLLQLISCYLYQCSIPVFEGLLPEPCNGMVLRLLYKAAEWHALAKLRIHTDSTLNLFDVVTREFGRLMRQFRDRTADEFDTVELPHEAGTQNRTGPSKKKKLNLNTYKFHALGDYVATIRLFGTTDSYSTQIVNFIFLFFTFVPGLTFYRGNLHTALLSVSTDSQTRRTPQNKSHAVIAGKITLVRRSPQGSRRMCKILRMISRMTRWTSTTLLRTPVIILLNWPPFRVAARRIPLLR